MDQRRPGLAAIVEIGAAMPSGSRGKFHFIASARLQKFLGEQLIADPNLAVIEFVKNAYDADATKVHIQFDITSSDMPDGRIVMSDNGTGMDRAEFESNWMHPGYSSKVDQRSTALGRTPIGEKGVGRLAAARLGRALHIYTRKNTSEQWLHVYIRWSDFDDMHRSLEDVVVPWDYTSEPDDVIYESGTRVEIVDLTVNWAGRLPGRKVPGRSDRRLGRLREDLSLLVFPIAGQSTDFSIQIKVDDKTLKSFSGFIEPDRPAFAAYTYRFQVAQTGSSLSVYRKVTRNDDVAAQVKKKVEESLIDEWPVGQIGPEGQPPTLSCGSIAGQFIYSPPQGRGRHIPFRPGVLLYRDGVRVEPYGWEDDWLGVRASKASRQGHAPIQPTAFAGQILIGKRENPELVDMSNRSGLVANQAYDDFLDVCQAEFKSFASLIYQEQLERRWREEAPQREQEQAQRARDFTERYVQTRLHAIRQPLASVDSLLVRLDLVADRADLPADARRTLREVLSTLRIRLRSLEDALGELSDVHDIEPQRFNPRDIVDEVVDWLRAEPVADKIDIEASGRSDDTIGPRPLLEEVLRELAVNAAEATSRNDGKRCVRIVVRDQPHRFTIMVQDNGPGFGGLSLEDVINEGVSEKGRPGNGLREAQLNIASLGGTITIREGEPWISTGAENGHQLHDAVTTVVVSVPRRDVE